MGGLLDRRKRPKAKVAPNHFDKANNCLRYRQTGASGLSGMGFKQIIAGTVRPAQPDCLQVGSVVQLVPGLVRRDATIGKGIQRQSMRALKIRFTNDPLLIIRRSRRWKKRMVYIL